MRAEVRSCASAPRGNFRRCSSSAFSAAAGRPAWSAALACDRIATSSAKLSAGRDDAAGARFSGASACGTAEGALSGTFSTGGWRRRSRGYRYRRGGPCRRRLRCSARGRALRPRRRSRRPPPRPSQRFRWRLLERLERSKARSSPPAPATAAEPRQQCLKHPLAIGVARP